MAWKILTNTGAIKSTDVSGTNIPTQTVLASGSGTYTIPTGCTEILVECIGGGGGSAGCAASASTATQTVSMGGGGGAYSSHLIRNPAASYAYAVGAGGTAGTAGASGGTGGDTTFGSTLCVAKGGTAGITGGNIGSGTALGFTTQSSGGAAASGAGNGTLLSGENSRGVRLDASHSESNGGTAARGGRGGLTQNNGAAASGAAGSVGEPIGGGAAGAWDTNLTARAGAAGATGAIIITEYYGTPSAIGTFPSQVTAPAYIASGLTGATAVSRYAGATTTAAPTAGNFAVGDYTVDQTGNVWICTTAGSPGTWKVASSGQIAYVEQTSNVTISGTTEAGATTLLDSGAITYAAQPIIVDAWGELNTGTGFAVGDSITLVLFDSGTPLGQPWFMLTSQNAHSEVWPFHVTRRLTPTAASHDYKISAFHSGAAVNMALSAGLGGTTTVMPAAIRVAYA